MTFSIADMRDEEDPATFTVWEVTEPTSPAGTPIGSGQAGPVVRRHCLLVRLAKGLAHACHRPKVVTTKDAGSVTAQEGTAGAPAVRSDDQRLGDLLPLGCRRLALELLRNKMIEQQSRRMLLQLSPLDIVNRGYGGSQGDRRQLIEGLVSNYIGLLVQSSRTKFSQSPVVVLERAAEEFHAAARLVPTYYQPPLNLGDTYVLLAETAGRAEAVAHADALKAVAQYDQTVRVLKSSRFQQRHPSEYALALALVRINQAVARFLTGDPHQIDEARKLPAQLRELEWRPEESTSVRTLRNLASWYGRMVTSSPDSDRERLRARGREVLAFAIGRDWFGAWTGGERGDPDLRTLVQDPDVDVELLIRLVRDRRVTQPCLHRSDRFVQDMDDLMTSAGWR